MFDLPFKPNWECVHYLVCNLGNSRMSRDSNNRNSIEVVFFFWSKEFSRLCVSDFVQTSRSYNTETCLNCWDFHCLLSYNWWCSKWICHIDMPVYIVYACNVCLLFVSLSLLCFLTQRKSSCSLSRGKLPQVQLLLILATTLIIKGICLHLQKI